MDGIFVDVFGADAPGFSAERQKTALQNTSRGFRPELCRLDLGWGILLLCIIELHPTSLQGARLREE